MEPVINYFFRHNDLTVQISCLKVLVKIVALEEYQLLPLRLNKLIELCLSNEDPQLILGTVCLLRQLGRIGLPILIEASRDKNILLAKASVTAIGEIDHISATNCLMELLEDESTDQLIKESITFTFSRD